MWACHGKREVQNGGDVGPHNGCIVFSPPRVADEAQCPNGSKRGDDGDGAHKASAVVYSRIDYVVCRPRHVWWGMPCPFQWIRSGVI
jgi:hypothetical protein